MPRSGTFRLAQGLRRDTGHPPGSAVKNLSLTIQRLTQWKPRINGPLPRRDALSSRRRADPQGAGTADGPRHPVSSITRDVFQARLTCPSQAIRGTKQTTYKDHSISTTQSRDGLWVAAFGRLNGEMMEVENTKRAVLETSPHEAETIAIADAQIQIDERDRDAS
jgi:hypothetical protein